MDADSGSAEQLKPLPQVFKLALRPHVPAPAVVDESNVAGTVANGVSWEVSPSKVAFCCLSADAALGWRSLDVETKKASVGGKALNRMASRKDTKRYTETTV